jgi:hypothetical protein
LDGGFDWLTQAALASRVADGETRRKMRLPPFVLEGEQVAVKKKATRKVNREGQRWTDSRPGMTLRLPIDLREAVTEESRVKGDLARIVLFALSHVEREKVDIMQTRKAGMELSNPQLLHIGAEARLKLKEWAEAEGVSVSAIVVSVLEEFFKRLKKSKALREELRLEIRAHRGFMPGDKNQF